MARSAADAPEIDGIVRIAGGNRLAIGDFARVTVTGASGHDLDARCALTDKLCGTDRNSSADASSHGPIWPARDGTAASTTAGVSL